MAQTQPQLFLNYLGKPWDGAQNAIKALADFGLAQNGKNDRLYLIGVEASSLLDFIAAEEDENEKKAHQTLASLLDVEGILNFIKEPNDPDVWDTVSNQIHLLSASFSLVAGTQEYTPQEIKEIFATGKDYDLARALHTFRQAIMGDHYEEITEYIYLLLSKEFVQENYELLWDEVLLYAMLINVLWFNYLKVDIDIQHDIAKHFFYKGIIFGAPVRSRIEEFFYDSDDFFDFLFKFDFFMTALEECDEDILINLIQPQYKTFKQIFAEYIKWAGEEKAHEGLRQQDFIKSIYGEQKGRDKFINWLLEAFYILIHIRNGTLIEKAKFEEQTDASLYDQDMVQLFRWYFAKKKWNNIVEYYKKENPRVPLGAFLGFFEGNYDLSKEETVQKVVEFTTLLKKEGILSDDQDIIEFDEEKGGFEWKVREIT